MTDKYLHGRSEAHEIETRLNVAYYSGCYGKNDEAEYHYDAALRQFEALAEILGYRVSRVVPEVASLHSISPQAAE